MEKLLASFKVEFRSQNFMRKENSIFLMDVFLPRLHTQNVYPTLLTVRARYFPRVFFLTDMFARLCFTFYGRRPCQNCLRESRNVCGTLALQLLCESDDILVFLGYFFILFKPVFNGSCFYSNFLIQTCI